MDAEDDQLAYAIGRLYAAACEIEWTDERIELALTGNDVVYGVWSDRTRPPHNVDWEVLKGREVLKKRPVIGTVRTSAVKCESREQAVRVRNMFRDRGADRPLQP
jgi:hypothetical protein